MKIHDLLLSVLKPGELLSYKEIKARILTAYPTLKSSSIIPSEHTSNPHGRCRRCQDQPVFKRFGHGLYQVLPQSEAAPELPMHDKLWQSLQPFAGEVLKVAQIRQAVVKNFPQTHHPSILPGDHIAGGACRICADQALLERDRQRGFYRVLPEAFAPKISTDTTDLLQQLLSPYQGRQFSGPQLEQALQQESTLSLREKHLLIQVLKTGIITELMTGKGQLEERQTHMAQHLYDSCGISLPLGLWAVQTWLNALRQTFQAHQAYPEGSLGLKVAAPATPDYAPQTLALQIYTDPQGTQTIFWHAHPIGKVWPAETGYWLGLRKRYLQPELKTLLPAPVSTWPTTQKKPYPFHLFFWFYCANQAELQHYLYILKGFYKNIN